VTTLAPSPRRPTGRCLLSVVAPVYEEEAGLAEFHRRASAALTALPEDFGYELVLVDDGSTDTSWGQLRQLAAEDSHVVAHRLSRNFGHQLAITAGTELARGDVVVIIDSDLQDPPELIGEMLARWLEGWDVVYGRRRSRAGESRFKLASARVFYRLLQRLSDVDLPLDAGDFRLMDRRVVDVLVNMPEQNRYIRGMVAWAGFRQCAVDYDRQPRHAGETNYTIRRMFRLAGDATVSFSDWPLTLATKLGFLVSVLSVVFLLGIVVAKIVNPTYALPGYTSLMAVVLFLGGVQMITIGILGQYVARIYRESKRRPLYVVAETAPTVDGRTLPFERASLAITDGDGPQHAVPGTARPSDAAR